MFALVCGPVIALNIINHPAILIPFMSFCHPLS